MQTIRFRVRQSVGWFSRTAFFRRIGPRIMPPLERITARLTRGRVQLSGLLVPSLVLHTIGAKSGIERDSYLMYCPGPDGELLVAGSNFGRDRHPAWTGNLLAHPGAAVTVRGHRTGVLATLISDPQERDTTWAWIERQWPDYRQYEQISRREIRIFRLVPSPGGV